MAGNSFGTIFKLSTFGESHGAAIGGVIDGCPAGVKLDFDFIQQELIRRKPGQSHITTQRKENDTVEFLSGVFEGVTTGTPIGFTIKNEDQKSKDYSHVKDAFRPSHADFTYEEKYGLRDYRGGGRSSARETACRIVAGAIAKLILKEKNISINAFVKQVGKIKLDKSFEELDFSKTETNVVRCPDEKIAEQMITYIEEIKKQGDTIGGIIQCVIKNTPIGLGEPVFDKLHAVLGHAMLSINAVKGFEIGSGFDSSNFKGSELNDAFLKSNQDDKKIKTKTNNSGGIQGGISNGMPIYFNVAFKPVATVMQKQNSVNKQGEEIILEGKGRHDPCVLPRAVPIVESMAALVLVDFLLLARCSRL
ncbi:MAG: chorismate synthase [Bacteroidota bacterium]|nr:chorismate synthase [Bacteroidota bacterium]MDP3145199.1 chorismate synthase [Bacteroidota bacterium]